jgi:hypothetical protein
MQARGETPLCRAQTQEVTPGLLELQVSISSAQCIALTKKSIQAETQKETAGLLGS